MPTDTSVPSRAEPIGRQGRAGRLPAGAGVILGMALGSLLWAGLLALFLM